MIKTCAGKKCLHFQFSEHNFPYIYPFVHTVPNTYNTLSPFNLSGEFFFTPTDFETLPFTSFICLLYFDLLFLMI